MARNRAERRHHRARLKKIRCRYHTAGDGSVRAVGVCLCTPCGCSCWMCGHQRYHHGPRMQEIRAKAKYTD
ncbi:hypothetical protein EYW98_07490 [Escherichia coli]|nr:hypothetical protein [Escherichia coli]EGO8376675.1 hypothetical protein [Escherichia coli]